MGKASLAGTFSFSTPSASQRKYAPNPSTWFSFNDDFPRTRSLLPSDVPKISAVSRKYCYFYTVEGFVSGKNLFAYAFTLYNIPMILELVSLCDGKKESMRI